MATYSGTPRTWSAGETVTAALMNSDVRDPLAALAGAWNSWTPTVAQSTSTNINKTVTYAKYIQVNKFIVGQFYLAMTGAGVAGSAVTVSVPVTAATTGLWVGVGAYADSDGSNYAAALNLSTSGTFALTRTDAPYTGVIGVSPNIAVASGDVIVGAFVYEAA